MARHLKTICELGGFCCLYGMAKKYPTTRELVAALEIDRRTAHRLRAKIRRREVVCEKKAGCWKEEPIA